MRRGSIVQLSLLGIVLGAAGTVVAVVVPWMPANASEERDGIDLVFWFTTAICIAVFALVFAVVGYSIWKFRAGPDDDSDGKPIHGHTGLEIVWTAIPAVLVTAISIISGVVLTQNDSPKKGYMDVNVVARQFAWLFVYPTKDDLESPMLRVPVGQSVKLHIQARDVLHSFWVPQFGQKQDAVPGQETELVITPTKIGTYPIICTELCGLGHALMRSKAIVTSQEDFDAWVKEAQEEAKGGGGGDAGKAAFAQNGCASCHALQAAGAAGTVGPDLDELPALAEKAGQPLEAFIEESIVDPGAYVEEGYQEGVMPPYNLAPQQLDALVQYLTKSSKGG